MKADKNGDPVQKAGSAAPEKFYTALTDNPYYPHQISLASQFGAEAGSGR